MSSQVVIITGAASGIGAAIALKFAEQDAAVCITDINGQDLRKTNAECRKVNNNKVLEVTADLRKDEDIDKIVSHAFKTFGKIDVLVNCAGIYARTNLQDSDIMDKYDKIFAVNLRSVVNMTRKTLPALVESKGCIINLSSICATIVLRNNLVYSMTKAAVTAFTKSAALELAREGVRVNCISPGPTRTNILKNAGIGEDECNVLWDKSEKSTPMKKHATVLDIAELAVYLASDKAASITGSDFLVDAGFMLRTLPDLESVNIVPNNVN